MFSKVHDFGGPHLKEGLAQSRELLGGKGANLAKMSQLGLSVPPGFTITTEVCSQFHANSKSFSPEVWNAIVTSIEALEGKTNRKFGDPLIPLLVSVRSGAAVSMPGIPQRSMSCTLYILKLSIGIGMMDTVLNLGLNDQTVKGLQLGGDRFAWVG